MFKVETARGVTQCPHTWAELSSVFYYVGKGEHDWRTIWSQYMLALRWLHSSTLLSSTMAFCCRCTAAFAKQSGSLSLGWDISLTVENTRSTAVLIQSTLRANTNVFVCVALLEQGRSGKDGTPGIKVSWANSSQIPLWKLLYISQARKKMAQQILTPHVPTHTHTHTHPQAIACWVHETYLPMRFLTIKLNEIQQI